MLVPLTCIVVFGSLAIVLVIIFGGRTHALIPLFAIGVFLCFTLSQTGMVRHWQKTRQPRWRRKAAMNAVGSATTALVTAIVIATKFAEGAWMVILAVPLLIVGFYAIARHYRSVGRRLRAKAHAVVARREPSNTVVLYVERLDAATREALWYARTISSGSFRAIHVPFEGSDSGIRPRFFQWSQGEPHLELLAPHEEPLEAVLEYIWAFPHAEGRFVTVVIPELFRRPSLLSAVLRRSTFSLPSRPQTSGTRSKRHRALGRDTKRRT